MAVRTEDVNMEKRNRKLGWTEFGIVALVFTPLGALFTVLGLLLWHFRAGNDPEDPEIFLYVFGGIGIVFLVIGLVFLGVDLTRRRRMRDAFDSGNYVMARIAGVQKRTGARVNGASFYVVECHYRDADTEKMHVCFSRYLCFDPTDMLTAGEVPVYIDRYSGKNVFVDIDAVLPDVEIHR